MVHRRLAIPLAFLFVSASTLFGCTSHSGAGASGGSDDDDRPLRILVTNDDGFDAEGLDAIVEALILDPENEVIVSAPDGNRSGTSENTDCGTLSTVDETTASGYPVTAIDGCPADAVNHALANLYTLGEDPHLVISGINSGQNVSELVAGLSGTIGAAKTAARSGVPALAVSQGHFHPGSQYDYAAGTEAVLAWLADHRDALLQSSTEPVDITSMNIPSCDAGSIRGVRIVPLNTAPAPTGFVDPPNCESMLQDPADDIEALNNGFVSQTSIPLN